MTAGIESGNSSAAGSNMVRDEARGDIAVHGLWEKGKTCILDTCITDTDIKSYDGSSLEKVLKRVAKLKKDKYAAPCIARRRSFAPLVYLVDGMTYKEAKRSEIHAMLLMAMKHDQYHGEMVFFFRVWMSFPSFTRTLSYFRM